MQGNNEASQGCPEDAASQSNSKENGAFIKRIVEPKDWKDATVYDFMNKNSSVILEPYAMVNQGYNGPFYRQETFPPPFVYPDFLMMQHVQLNAFENNIYPVNLNYSYPVENRFSYMPTVNMFSQPYPYKGYIQEFQYFVVIDFEATCDKERNLHPQEIIEFPSVLVNSATGQLEAFFQTYVRPAYHQHLTDFCKELTGIQQIQVLASFLLVYFCGLSYILNIVYLCYSDTMKFKYFNVNCIFCIHIDALCYDYHILQVINALHLFGMHSMW